VKKPKTRRPLERIVLLVLLVLLVGLINGGVIEPFMRWIGHPVTDPQAVWFTILCVVALPIILVLTKTVWRA
jgi:hypothetical protein